MIYLLTFCNTRENILSSVLQKVKREYSLFGIAGYYFTHTVVKFIIYPLTMIALFKNSFVESSTWFSVLVISWAMFKRLT